MVKVRVSLRDSDRVMVYFFLFYVAGLRIFGLKSMI